MSEELIRSWLTEYWTTILSDLAVYGAYFAAALVLFWVCLLYVNRARRRMSSSPVYDVPPLAAQGSDDPFAIPAPVIPAAARPTNGHFFETVIRFAAEKMVDGRALFPQERFALGELAFLQRILVRDGLAHLDSFEDGLPFKSFELRRALDEIGAIDVHDLIERAIAVALHRHELLRGMTSLGVSRQDALLHEDLPEYAPLEAQIRAAGVAAQFVAKADVYFEASYPWADSR